MPRLDDLQQGNMEALASSETYILNDCTYGTSYGSGMEYNVFCNSMTGPYLIFDCEYSCMSPLSMYGKCVEYKW